MNKAQGYLEQAVKDMKSRASERDAGDGERSMARTVNAFNAMHGTSLTEVQGWQFMELLKMSRSIGGSFRADDFIDAAAYAALAGEAADPHPGHCHNLNFNSDVPGACKMRNGTFKLEVGVNYLIESVENNSGNAGFSGDALYLGQANSVGSFWDKWVRVSDQAIFCLERNKTSVYLD